MSPTVRSIAARACLRAWALPVFLLAMPLAAAAPPLTLEAAVQRAVERAPSLEASAAAITAADEEVARAAALPDPMLMVGIDNLPATGPDAFDTSADMMTMRRIGLRQEIPARAKRLSRRTLASRGADEARASATAERLSVRQAASDAWIAVWASRRELHALQGLREQAGLAAQLARARFAAGGESASDALAAEAAVLELDTRIEASRATEAAGVAGLRRWIGEEIGDIAADAPTFDVLAIPEAELLAGVDRTAALLPAVAQLETAAAAVDLARAEKRVDWSIAASYGQRAGGRDDMLMLEVGIGLPLLARHRQDRGIAAREAEYQATLSTREHLRRQAEARIRTDIARWDGLRRQVALYEDALLPLAADRSRVTLAAYRAGGPLQPWLDARGDELSAHLAHAEHLGALGRAWAALAFQLPERQP